MIKQKTISFSALLLFCSFAIKTDNQKIQKDLRLIATYHHTEKQKNGGTLTLSIMNNSSTDHYKIIMPGDGSENSWREPYIYYSADFKSEQGVWEKLEFHKPSRCGNYDSNWQKEFITIKPKQTSPYSESIFRVNQYFTIKSDGTIRLVVHYDYAQGRHSREKENNLNRDIADIPAFALVSDTIEFKVVK